MCSFIIHKRKGLLKNQLLCCRVRLSKRRKGAGGAPTSNTRLIVKHRLLNEQEEAAQVRSNDSTQRQTGYIWSNTVSSRYDQPTVHRERPCLVKWSLNWVRTAFVLTTPLLVKYSQCWYPFLNLKINIISNNMDFATVTLPTKQK